MKTGAASAGFRHLPLLERTDELERIERCLRAARAGQGSILLLEGPPGIGKTTLLAETRSLAEAYGLRHLGARGSDLEHDFAYGVVRQLLEPPLLAGDVASPPELLQGAAALAAPALGAAAVARDPGSRETSYTVLHGLYWLCANLAQREPLVLSVDDAHWADAPSLRFLAYLARRIDELPIALVVASEVEAESGPLSQLATDSHVEVLSPSPLSSDGVAALLAAELGGDADESFVAACHTATGGVPFLVRELIAALRDDRVEPTAAAVERVGELGPRTIARSVLLRLGRLGPAAGELARTLAVLGPGAELREAAVLSVLDYSSAAEAADLLEAAGITMRERPLAFAHRIVQAAIYGELGPGDRARRHAEAARLLAAQQEPLERVAAHLLAAEPAAQAWAVDVLRGAAAEARSRGAPDSAAAYLRRALAEPPPAADRVALLLELGSAETHSGDDAAVEHLEEALGSAGEPAQLADAALMLGRALVLAHRPKRAAETFEHAVRAFAGSDPELELLFESAVVGVAQTDVATAPLLEGRFERLRELAGRADRVPRAVHSVLAFAAASESAQQAAELAERALEGLPRPYPGSGDPYLFFFACSGLLFSERFERAAALYDAALEDAQQAGSVPRFVAASCFRSWNSYRIGELAEAEADARLALEACSENALDWYLPFSAAMVLEPLVERGELDQAEDELARSGAAAQERTSYSFMLLLYARGRLRLAQERAQEALADLLAAGAGLERMRAGGPAVCGWRSEAALAHAALGEQDEARRLAAAELELARSFGARRTLGVALRVAGVVEGGEQGLALLVDAAATLEQSPARLEYARALTDLGSALRRAGQRQEARMRLRLGLDLAYRCRAPALVERAREELVAAGSRPRRALLTGVEALTPSELRIVRMAAEGRANREIAQALFVTARTVETHLTHAYQKLGINSRDELPDALGASG
jgi:DNA-binding CsgD family transcriptional regulator